MKLAPAETGKTAIVIPLPPKAPIVEAAAPAGRLQPRRRKAGELLGAIALFMVLIGSSMLAVGLVAVLLFR